MKSKANWEPLDGGFDSKCQETYVTPSLKTLITMVLREPNVEITNNPCFNQAALTISQLAIFKATIQRGKSSAQAFRTTRRKPPLAIYRRQLLHSYTRKLDLVRKISYLILAISANSDIVIEPFGRENVVYPLSLRYGLFITTATDNVDVNPKSALL